MTSHRVWMDPHGNEMWLWREDVTEDPNMITMQTISPEHKGQTLVLDLDKKEYKWTVPGQNPIVFPISSKS